MMHLELHIVATSSSQKLLEVVEERITEVLSYYSKYFDGSELAEFEIGGGITEVGDVQEEPASLPN
jgi:hypothetical protein